MASYDHHSAHTSSLPTLQSFLSRIHSLPTDTKELFHELRSIDSRYHEAKNNFEALQADFLEGLKEGKFQPLTERQKRALKRKRAEAQVKAEEGVSEDDTRAPPSSTVRPDEAKEECLERISQAKDELLSLATDKIQLSVKSYDLIDNHIRVLDGITKQYETELRKGRFDAPSTPINMKLHPFEPPSPYLSMLNTVSSSLASPTKFVTLGGTEKKASSGFDIPVDPSEPVYCTCRKVSYGEMVACDNLDCSIEWFHFACVDLEQQPKGKWYCKDCRETMAALPAEQADAGTDAKPAAPKRKRRRKSAKYS